MECDTNGFTLSSFACKGRVPLKNSKCKLFPKGGGWGRPKSLHLIKFIFEESTKN